MQKPSDQRKGPRISQYDPGPEKQVSEHVARKNPEYEIFQFTGHLKVTTKVPELGHVHEYEKVRESKYRSYDKVRDYELKPYKANFISREQYEVVKEEKAIEKEKLTSKKKTKLKYGDTTRDDTQHPKQRVPYLIGPEAPLHEYEYKEYQLQVYDFEKFDFTRHRDYMDIKIESYMDRKIDNFHPPHEYIFTDDNFCPFKYRDVFEKQVEKEITEEEQAFLDNMKFMKMYKRSKFIPVVNPKWSKDTFSKQSPPPQYSSLSVALPKPKKGENTVTFENLPDIKTVK